MEISALQQSMATT